MKKTIIVLFMLLMPFAFCEESMEGITNTYTEKNKLGLIRDDVKITNPIFTKLIRLNDESFLFCYKGKYGIISNNGDILVDPEYSRAQRLLGKYARLGSGSKFALYNESGDMILDRQYQSINLLFGRMFLVEKNYQYGLVSFDGDIIMAPVAADIYMPEKNVIKILYDGNWYTIEQKDKDMIELPEDFLAFPDDSFTISKIIEQPITSTGYGLVSAGDYFVKLFSSISPAYEETIDELLFYHGADTANILLKSSWIVKFPFVYTKNYFNTLKAPNNGPFNNAKANVRHKLRS